MGIKLNPDAQIKMLKENIKWLRKQEHSLERDHTVMVLEDQITQISEGSWDIQQTLIATLRHQRDHYKAQLHTYLQEIVKAHKGLRRLTKKMEITKDRCSVDKNQRLQLLIHLKCLMDAIKPYLFSKKIKLCGDCYKLNMAFGSCNHIYYAQTTEEERCWLGDKEIIVNEKKNEEITVKMLAYLEEHKRLTGKAIYDAQIVSGLLNVVRVYDREDNGE